MLRPIALACFLVSALLPMRTFASDSECFARLNAAIAPGALEIITGDTVELRTVLGFEHAGAERYQADAVSFLVDGITVNDLNGDGRGFRLSASAEPLTHREDGVEAMLPVGTVRGFRNPNAGAGMVLVEPSVVLYERGEGIAGFEIDYEIAFDVPERSPEGLYLGLLQLELSAL